MEINNLFTNKSFRVVFKAFLLFRRYKMWLSIGIVTCYNIFFIKNYNFFLENGFLTGDKLTWLLLCSAWRPFSLFFRFQKSKYHMCRLKTAKYFWHGNIFFWKLGLLCLNLICFWIDHSIEYLEYNPKYIFIQSEACISTYLSFF